jgi:hypothetical protein
MASYDDILNGTFDTLGMPRLSQSEQLQWLNTYAGANPALSAIKAATPTGNMAPAGWMSYQGGVPVAAAGGGAAMPPVPQRRPESAPTRMDTAAMGATPSVNRVTGKMEQSNPLAGLFGGGGLLGLLTGPAKNGLPGLAGLLGGPQQGGLLQMLLSGGRQQQPTAGGTAARGPAVTTVGRALGTNGYVYGLGSNGKYSQQGQSPALAGLTPSQQYSALTGGPGSVAAMELLHSGASRNPQSGGPAGGGEYGGGR